MGEGIRENHRRIEVTQFQAFVFCFIVFLIWILYHLKNRINKLEGDFRKLEDFILSGKCRENTEE